MFTLGEEDYTAYTPEFGDLGGHLRILPPVRVELQLAWEWSGRRRHRLLSRTSGGKGEPRSVPPRVGHSASCLSASLGAREGLCDEWWLPTATSAVCSLQAREAAFGPRREKHQSQAMQVAVTTRLALEKAGIAWL